MTARLSVEERKALVNQRVDIAAVIGREVNLSRHSKPRGKCPFHGSKSDSLAVYPESNKARCWGCQWSGDAIGFVQDYYGLDFMSALSRLEGDLGIDPGAAGTDQLFSKPVRRVKAEQQRQAPRTVDSAVVARHLWASAVHDPESLRVWLRARRVPDAMLGDHWFDQLRFCPSAPIAAWPVGKDHDAVAHAPAMVGLMRSIVDVDGRRSLRPGGVHATFLSPGLKAKMNRKRSDGEQVAARKMFGASARAFVVLGRYRRDCPLYVGEGIETVLSGMALCGAGEDACGLAVLSLDNLQGKAKAWKNGVLPLYAIEPDPARTGVCFAHDGPVTGLIDADMKPLKGWRDPQTRELRPPSVVERRGGPVVARTISSAERSEICAALFTKMWRAAGCARVSAIRPHMGMDFNDLAREYA